MLNEGSRRGWLGQGDGFKLVCGSVGRVLVLLRTMSLDGFGQSHRHHVGRCSASIQERKLREKSERRNEMREKRSEWGFSSREEAEREE